jgi:hypothetical protein
VYESGCIKQGLTVYGKDDEGKIDKGKCIRPRGPCMACPKFIRSTHGCVTSAIKTYDYELAKNLSMGFSNRSSTTLFMLTGTYDFVNKIGDVCPFTDCYMASFDVESSRGVGISGKCPPRFKISKRGLRIFFSNFIIYMFITLLISYIFKSVISCACFYQFLTFSVVYITTCIYYSI